MAKKTSGSDPSKEIIKAAKAGDLAKVKKLLAASGDLLTVRDRDGSTPLHCAAWKGHVATVEFLLDAGADLHDHNDNSHWGTTPLHAAAHGNQKQVAELLLARGADVNAESRQGTTPLQETEVHKASAVARILVANGAL